MRIDAAVDINATVYHVSDDVINRIFVVFHTELYCIGFTGQPACRKPYVGNQDRVKRPFPCRRRKRGGTRRFHMTVEGFVIRSELLVMGPVATFSSVIHGKRHARIFTTDTAGCLNVFTGEFRLSHQKHHVQPRHVNSDGDHVRCQ